jgi:hypothetical protein
MLVCLPPWRFVAKLRHRGQVQQKLLLLLHLWGWRWVGQASVRPSCNRKTRCRLGRVASAMSASEVVEVPVTSNLRSPTCSAAGTLAFRTVSISLGHVVTWHEQLNKTHNKLAWGEGWMHATHCSHYGIWLPSASTSGSTPLQTKETRTRNDQSS